MPTTQEVAAARDAYRDYIHTVGMCRFPSPLHFLHEAAIRKALEAAERIRSETNK